MKISKTNPIETLEKELLNFFKIVLTLKFESPIIPIHKQRHLDKTRLRTLQVEGLREKFEIIEN